jgi:VanZ family protein
MTQSRFDRGFLLVSVGIVAVIVHGSLYPYAFRIPPHSVGAIATLMDSWSTPPTSFGDFVANVLLYVPLGFFGVLALDSPRRLEAVTLFGLLLCTAIELAQFYDVGRVTNMSDVYLNTSGTCLCGIAGTLFGAQSRRVLPGALRSHPVACLLLVALLGYRLFPFVPVIDMHKYWHALKPILSHPSIAPLPVFHYFVLWFTVCYLVTSIAGRRFARTAVLLFAVFVFGAKVAIVNLTISMPEIVGSVSAFAFWFLFLARSRAAGPIVASLLCAMIITFRLAPFDFHSSGGAFGWLPFRSYLGGSLDTNIVSFLEKFFLYGSLIWIASEAGLRIRTATGATAALLLATSLAETHLPGRSAEITDAVMALLVGAIFATMIRVRDEGSPQGGLRSSEQQIPAAIAFQSGMHARTNRNGACSVQQEKCPP